MEISGSQMGESSKLGGFSSLQAGRNVAGVRRSDDVRRVDSMAYDSMVIESKARRRTAGRYRVNWDSIEAAAIIDLWEVTHGREDIGGSLEVIVDWTGSAAAWKAKTFRRIETAIKEGLLERIPNPSTGTGTRIIISGKGRQILEGYCKVYDEIIEEMESRRVERLLKKEAARLKREAIRMEREEGKPRRSLQG